jgi:prefoldin subunit 2
MSVECICLTIRSKREAQPTQQEVVDQFGKMRQEVNSIAQKINELQMEQNEHQYFTSNFIVSNRLRLVEATLKGVDPSRRCFRSVGGVLVERTVKEVLPAIAGNKEQVKLSHDLLIIKDNSADWSVRRTV